MGPVGVVVPLLGLHARLAGDWEGAGWHSPVILRCREFLIQVEVYSVPQRLCDAAESSRRPSEPQLRWGLTWDGERGSV